MNDVTITIGPALVDAVRLFVFIAAASPAVAYLLVRIASPFQE